MSSAAHKHLFAALFIACLAALPLLSEPGLLNTRGGGDSPFLLQRLHQLEAALRDGHFPVRWMPDANYGYGYPFYNYYAPLSIYIAAFFRFLGFSYIRALHLAQLSGFLVAAWGMFRLAHRWWQNEWAALTASVAYTLAPFHLVNVYVRGDSLAEFWAMAFYPLILLSADRLFDSHGRSETSSRLATFALAYAALIISHNISALIFSPFLLLYLLSRSYSRPRQRLVPPLLGLLLAFGLAAWFFVPALAEQSLAQLGPVTDGYFHFSNHFRGLTLVQTSWLFEYGVAGGNAFRMGLVQAITAVFGLLLLLQQRSPHRLFISLSLLIATFMITPLSNLLWEHLPLLPLTQFPWRFLSIQAFAAALATAGLARLRWQPLTASLIVGLLLVASLARLETDHLRLTDADITAEKLAQYEWFTGNIGTTVSAEYLPQTVIPRPYTSRWLLTSERNQLVSVTGELLAAQLLERKATRQQWQVETAVSSQLLFPTLHWPGWRATINGQTADLQAAPGSGLMLLTVPAGSHTVTLELTRTPVRLAAELLSLTAVLLTLILLGQGLQPQQWRRWLGTAIALGSLWFVAQFDRPQPLDDGQLTWDFAQMGYLHHDVDGVAFSNGSRLHRYDYSAETVQAGENWSATFTFAANPTETVTLSLLTPANVWPALQERAQAPPFVSQTETAVSPTFRFELPASLPPGLYLPQLTPANGQPLLPSGKTRGSLLLRPIRVLAAPAATTDGLNVTATGASVLDSRLTTQLQWGTERPLTSDDNVALRLLDATGQELAALDTQPGYGFLPSSLWPTGETINDWLTLPLPDPLGGTPPYALTARLYEVATGEIRLTRRLGELSATGEFSPHAPQQSLPPGLELVPQTAVFLSNDEPLIQLDGYQLSQNGNRLTLTLVWHSVGQSQQDYTRFVHLLDAAGKLVAQNDAFPLGNSYPTSQWQLGERVVDQVQIDLATAAVDSIALGFYLNDGVDFPRLTAVSAAGSPLPNNTVVLQR